MIAISCLWWCLFISQYVVEEVQGFLIPAHQTTSQATPPQRQQYPKISVLFVGGIDSDNDNDASESSKKFTNRRKGGGGGGGMCSSRRDMLTTSLFTAATTISSAVLTTTKPNPAHGHGLVQFPCQEGTLKNNYNFMRAGESLLENQNVWGTNPMFLTNRVDNQLSELGHQQVTDACNKIRPYNLAISQVKFPLTANAMDTAKQVKEELLIPGNVVVPEYTYLDQRGIGQWDMLPQDKTQNAIWAMDDMEAGYDGRGGLPPPNTDGTPNETLYNQVTRLRQLLSITETYNSGDTILFIFPDGTGPALLSCLIAGIPLNRVHELHFDPGEVRLDISYDSVRASLPTQPTAEYLTALERGKVELAHLRNNPTGIKCQKYVCPPQKDEQEQYTAEEQIAKRQQQYEAAAAKRVKEQEESNNRRQQQQQQNMEQRDQQRKNEMKIYDDANPKIETAKQSLIALITLGVGAGLTSSMFSTEPEPEPEPLRSQQEKTKNVSGPADEGHSAVLGAGGGETEQKGDSEVEAPLGETKSMSASQFREVEVLEDLVETASFDIPEFALSKKEDHANRNRENARKEKQLIQEAEKAMNDYLNQDDGANEYDSWMSQLLLEEDE